MGGFPEEDFIPPGVQYSRWGGMRAGQGETRIESGVGIWGIAIVIAHSLPPTKSGQRLKKYKQKHFSDKGVVV